MNSWDYILKEYERLYGPGFPGLARPLTKEEQIAFEDGRLPKDIFDFDDPPIPLGTRVSILNGPNKGQSGKIFWAGHSKHGPGLRYGLRDGNGIAIWVSATQLESTAVGGEITIRRSGGKVIPPVRNPNMTKKSSERPTWSVCLGDDQLLIIKTANAARAGLVARSYGAEHCIILNDLPRTQPNGGYGSAYRSAVTGYPQYFDQWELGDIPTDFNLAKLAELDGALILNEEGVELSDDEIKNLGKERKVSSSKSDLGTSDGASVKEKVIGSVKTMAGAAVLGGKLAMAGKANEAAYEKFKEILIAKGVSPKLANDTAFKAAMMTVLPVSMHAMISAFEDKVPYASVIKPGLELSVTDTVREHSTEVIDLTTQLAQAMYMAYKTSPATATAQAPKLRIDVDYDDYRTVKLKSMAKARELGLKARASRDALIAALQLADAQEAEATEENEQSHLTV